MPISPKCPREFIHYGLCIDCAIHLLISTDFCTVFEDNLESMNSENGKSNKTVSELERFRNIEHQMNLFVDILSIPSILEFVLNHKQNLLAKCIRLLTATDQFYRVYKSFTDVWHEMSDPDSYSDTPANSCSKCKTFSSMINALLLRSPNEAAKHLKKAMLYHQRHLHDHIIEDVWDSHERAEKLMVTLYHRAKSLEFLESILQIDNGTDLEILADFFHFSCLLAS